MKPARYIRKMNGPLHYFAFHFRQSRCSPFSSRPRADALRSGFVPAVLWGCSALIELSALPTFPFAVLLRRFGNVRTMVRRTGRTSGARQEGCTSTVGWVGRGTGMGQQQLPLLSPSSRSSAPFPACFPPPQHLFLPLSPPPAPSPRWPGLTLLLKSPFLGDSHDPGLPTLELPSPGVSGGDWSQSPALLCLLGLCNPRMFKKAQ